MPTLSELTMAQIALVHQSITGVTTTIKTFNTRSKGISRLEAILGEKKMTLADALRAAGLAVGLSDTDQEEADTRAAALLGAATDAEPAVAPAASGTTLHGEQSHVEPASRLTGEDVVAECRNLLISHLTTRWGVGAEEAGEAAERAMRALVATPTAARPRSNTKMGTVIGMLKRPGGATIAEIGAAVGWQKHTVRGVFAGQIKRKLGLLVISEKAEGCARRYRIADTSGSPS